MNEEEILKLITPFLVTLHGLEVARLRAFVAARDLVEEMPVEHRWRVLEAANALEDFEQTIEKIEGTVKP